jgi:hypothetical protein
MWNQLVHGVGVAGVAIGAKDGLANLMSTLQTG